MSFIEIDDIKLYYNVQGDGSSLVFIHAGIADSRMWDEQVKKFSNSFKVVTYDMRGYGQSCISESEFSHAKDLKVLLDYLGMQKAHIVACSFGCQILFDFSIEYPENVLSLTFVNGRYAGFTSEKPDPPPLEKEIIEAYESKDITKIAELESLIWFVGRYRKKEDVDSNLLQKVMEMDKIALQNEMTSPSNDKMLHPDQKRLISNISVPTCFIIGSMDEPNMVKSCKIIGKALKSKIYYLSECTHLPNMEQPEEFNNYLETFLYSIE